MRTVIFLLLSLSTFVTYGQSSLKNGCSGIDETNRESFAYAAAKVTGFLVLNDVDSTSWSNTYKYAFVDSKGAPLYLSFRYSKMDKQWKWDKVIGDYADVRSIYQIYFGRQADLDNVSDAWNPVCNGKKINVTLVKLDDGRGQLNL